MSEQADKQTKSPWREPRLIVLARCRGEEAVLLGCKGVPGFDHSLNHFDACHSDAPGCTTLCRDIHTS